MPYNASDLAAYLHEVEAEHDVEKKLATKVDRIALAEDNIENDV